VTEDGEPMWIEVLSDDAPEFKRLQAQYRNDALRNPQKKMTAEKEEARMTELLVAATVNWCIADTGGLMEFNKNTVRDVYQNRAWIRNQVVVAVFDDANFMGELKAA
jgi:hypothetical protein